MPKSENPKYLLSKLLACAVSELFPHTQFIEGNETFTGFYYDFIFKEDFDSKSLVFLEERMHALLRESPEIQNMEMMRDNAKELFRHRHQKIQGGLIASQKEPLVSIVKIGDFYDMTDRDLYLDADMHQAREFKLSDVRQIIHRSDKFGSQSATRIEGVYSEKEKGNKYLKKVENQKKGDHISWAEKLGYFRFSEENPEIPLWLPKGEFVKRALRLFMTESVEKVHSVSTPLALESPGKDREELVFTEQGLNFGLFPDPRYYHSMLFNQESCRENLPSGYFEWRKSLVFPDLNRLNGLYSSIEQTRDFLSLFCMESEILVPLISSLLFIEKTINIYGFEYYWYLALPEKGKRIDKAVEKIRKAFSESEMVLEREEIDPGLLGPTAYLIVVDSIEREWKCSCVGIDLFHPENLGLFVEDSEGRKHRPWLLSRSVCCSLEAMIALLVEKYAGDFPLFLDQLKRESREDFI